MTWSIINFVIALKIINTGYEGLSVEDFINLPSGYDFVSSNPATFQLGITDYDITANYTVPAGYINTNDVIPCPSDTSFDTILEQLDCPTLSSLVFPSSGISGDTVNLTGDLPAPFTGYTLGNGYTISPATYTGTIGDNTTYTITFDTPNGYYTMNGNTPVTDGTIDCTYDARTIGVFTCDMASINILEGEVGADIQFTFNTATETSLSPFNCPTIAIPAGTLDATIDTNGITLNPGNVGTVDSVSPDTYQLGEYTYDVTITVADGFEGQGTTEICPATVRTCYVPVDGVPAFTATVID